VRVLGVQSMGVNFDRAFNILMQFEGGYVNDPSDPGGETKYGISKKAYPDEDIKNLTMDRAKELYKRDYWDAAGCDSLPEGIDICTFDTAVNCGLSVGKKIANETDSVQEYILKRMLYYSALVERKDSLRKYFRGWIGRCLTLWQKLK